MAARGDVALVHRIPNCDLCKHYTNADVPASYDGKTVHGPWANMCQRHMDSEGVGLGVGRGQRLVLAPRHEREAQ